MKTWMRIICLAIAAIMLRNWILWNKASFQPETSDHFRNYVESAKSPKISIDSDGSHPQQPIKLSQQLETTEFFSSCLLVFDEGHRLPEWLAYHYYMLPLRHLVIMSDPSAITDPSSILERWKPYMEITVWSDERINFQPSDEEGHPKAAVQIHRERQRFFYKACAAYLRSINRTWVTFHDVDEYVTIDAEVVPNAHERIQRPGSVLQLIQEHAVSKGPPPTPQIKSLAQLHETSCLIVPRAYFGATESPELVQKLVPSFLIGRHFETLRFVYRIDHSNAHNGRGKSLVHVSRPESLDFKDKGVHSLISTCKTRDVKQAAIRIRHYLGTWEVYTSRLDPRRGGFRNRQHYLYRSELGRDRPPDDFVRPWLKGFCDQFYNNETVIRKLLEGTGQVVVSPDIQKLSANVSAWSLPPTRIKELIDSKAATNKPGSFPHWLKEHYKVQNQSGVLVVDTRTGRFDKSYRTDLSKTRASSLLSE